MRRAIVTLLAASVVVFYASIARAQAGAGGNNTLYNKLSQSVGPGGPPPVRDMSGLWTAQSLSARDSDPIPQMTPLAMERFKENRSEAKFGIVASNDPWKTCDPFGIPRGLVEETRGIAFAQMSGKIVLLHQYQKIWRDIWMDGRQLPKNVDARGGPPSRWYGYSVGHWEGDYTLVIDTVGADDRSWLDGAGHPHSVDAHVQERYTRVNHNYMDYSVTIDDPKMYAKPFVLGKNKYLLVPGQETEEQFCIPSEMLSYVQTIAVPSDKSEEKK
jgi:hypothetical protein